MKGLEVMTLSKRLKKMTSQKESNEDTLKNTSAFFITNSQQEKNLYSESDNSESSSSIFL